MHFRPKGRRRQVNFVGDGVMNYCKRKRFRAHGCGRVRVWAVKVNILAGFVLNSSIDLGIGHS